MRQAKGDKVKAVLKQAMTTAREVVGERNLAEAKQNNGTVISLEIDTDEDSHPLLEHIMTTYSACANLDFTQIFFPNGVKELA